MMPFPAEAVSRVKVLVAGDIMLDRYWFGEVDRISPEAPVPVVRVARREDRLGGAANVARNIVALGAQASLLGLVGGDEAGGRVRDLAREAGRSEEHTSELQSLMRISYAVFCLNKQTEKQRIEESTQKI